MITKKYKIYTNLFRLSVYQEVRLENVSINKLIIFSLHILNNSLIEFKN